MEAKCLHVILIENRVAGLEDEQEYLFAPYSVFKVASVEWGEGTDEDLYKIPLHATTKHNQGAFLPRRGRSERRVLLDVINGLVVPSQFQSQHYNHENRVQLIRMLV